MDPEASGSGLGWLPELIELNQFGGDWERYVDAIYAIFSRDFLSASPSFRGKRVIVSNRPPFNGKDGTFVHLTTEGESGADEESRLTNLMRCARIPWLKPILENPDPDQVIAYADSNGRRQERWVVCLADYSFVIVLQNMKRVCMLITAFVPSPGRKRTLKKRFDEFMKITGGLI